VHEKNGEPKYVEASAHQGHVCVHRCTSLGRNESIRCLQCCPFEEWNSATINPKIDPIVQKRLSIHTTEEAANLHRVRSPTTRKNVDSSVTLQFDDKLHDWLDFVTSRGVLV
jgi:hypothetical protein